jgi:hypothetical protein
MTGFLILLEAAKNSGQQPYDDHDVFYRLSLTDHYNAINA